MLRNFNEKLGRMWWTENIRYFVYFVREFSGVVIALYVTYLLVVLFEDDFSGWRYRFFIIFSWISFFFSLIHAGTWLWVSAKLIPPKIATVNGSWQILKFIGLLFLWVIVCYFLYTNAYEARYFDPA